MRVLSRLPIMFALVAVLGFASEAVAQAQQVPAATAQRLQRIMIPLIQHMNNPIPLDHVKVHLTADEDINAANGAGGEFYITRGLLEKAADDDVIRAIMAHEVAHADLGHVANQQRLNTGLGIGLAILDQIWPQAGAIAPIAGQFVANAYSRSEESEADAHGVEILRRAGFDGKRLMVNSLSWLAQIQGDSGGFFATHPLTSDRIAAVQRLP